MGMKSRESWLNVSGEWLFEAEAATSILSDDRFSKLFKMEDYEVHTSFYFRLVKLFRVVIVCVRLYFRNSHSVQQQKSNNGGNSILILYNLLRAQ